jgi:hypothetical protein
MLAQLSKLELSLFLQGVGLSRRALVPQMQFEMLAG